MERFTKAVRSSLESKNWYAATYLSLTLPDICARLEAPDGKTSGQKYVSWFDRYLLSNYRHEIGASREPHVFLSGNDCYALRCAMLHEGSADISTQKCKETLEKIHFTIGVGADCNQFGSILQLDVARFCGHVCSAVESWYVDFKSNHADKTSRINELVEIHEGPHTMGGKVRFS